MSRASDTTDREIRPLTAQLSILQRQEDAYARIAEDMVRLQDSVRAEREALSLKITELKNEKQPVTRLPAELLIEIFLIRTKDKSVNMDFGLSYNPAPVLISHVCHKWRKLALGTSCLWSFISYWTPEWIPRPLTVFLERAGSSPISFKFISTTSSVSSTGVSPLEVTTSIGIVHALCRKRRRFRSLGFKCGLTKSMEYILAGITRIYSHLHDLESLNLELTDYDPCFKGTQLLNSNLLFMDQSPPDCQIALRHLYLRDMPVTILPAFVVRTIHTLELSAYRCGPQHLMRPHYFILRLSHLIDLLRHTPHLHKLSLNGVTLMRDVVTGLPTGKQVIHDATPHDLASVSSVELPELKRLSWEYANHRDVFPLMSLLNLPGLERWDLTITGPIEFFDASQLNGNHHHYQASLIQAEPLSSVLVLHALKDLNVTQRCQDEDSLSSSLRQFLLTSLTTLSITFADHQSRKELSLPSLPRLESMFRDPRLPHLTHLSISNFDILPAHGRSMLGYTPSLVSLTLVLCTGVNVILDALAEAYGCVPMRKEPQTQLHGVHVCPLLEYLMLWSCSDVDFEMLKSTVHTRSPIPDEEEDGQWETDTLEAEMSAVLGREERPLKKMRNVETRPPQQHADSCGPTASGSSASTFIPTQKASHPTRLACLHISDCPQISHREALSLGRWGTRVIYQ